MKSLWLTFLGLTFIGVVLNRGRRRRNQQLVDLRRVRRFTEAESRAVWKAIHTHDDEARAAWQKLLEDSKQVLKVRADRV